MTVIDMLEELGALVDAGLLSEDDATRRLVQFSDGFLTPAAARRDIRGWQTRRGSITRQLADARRFLGALGKGGVS